MKYFFTAIAFLAILQANAYVSMPQDSVGIETVDGKTYIIHEVMDKETLYSVSRRYNVSIYKIIENNPPAEFGLEVGQRLRIPYEKKEKPVVKVVQKPKEEPKQKPIVAVQDNVVEDQYHIVQPGQTLFAISRIYSVTVADIQKWNGFKGTAIDIGQKIIVKSSKKDPSVEKSSVDEVPVAINGRHIVKPSETLYSLSRKYNVSIDDIKKWNDLVDNDLSIGQELIVKRVAKARNNDRIDRVTTPTSKATEANDETVDGTKKDSVVKSTPSASKATKQTNFEELEESGMAELIDGSRNTRKYLALHRTAKIGTIMRVKNEMNDQEVFVRVLGRLPDTGLNKNVLIKISKSAYDRLGAIDPKFRVKISYIP